jgi:hypothetical protein
MDISRYSIRQLEQPQEKIFIREPEAAGQGGAKNNKEHLAWQREDFAALCSQHDALRPMLWASRFKLSSPYIF